jgi:hypothetical protein
MVTRSTQVAEQSGRKAIGPAVQAVGGLLLALAVAAGIGGRYLAQERDAGRSAAPPASVVTTPQTVPADAASVFTVYVVGSQDQATALEAGLKYANRVRHAAGESPLRYAVVVVGPADADTVLRALHDDGGWTPLQVVDLLAGS